MWLILATIGEKSACGSAHIQVCCGKTMSEVMYVQEVTTGSSKTGKNPPREEKPISKVYPVLDNDLARDNVENDIPAADLEDL